MAAEQDLKLDQQDAQAEGGGSKKTLILIIVGALLLIGIAVGATIFLMSGSDEGEEEKEEVAAEETAEEAAPAEAPIPAQYVKLKPEFVVNFNVGTRQRFLQVSIEIMTRSQTIVDAIELHSPMLRNEIIRILSDQDFNNLRTPEGKVAMQEQLKEHIASTLKRESGVDGVEALLFTNFVMQ